MIWSYVTVLAQGIAEPPVLSPCSGSFTPHKDMAKNDDILRAHLANDEPHAAASARYLYTQINTDRFKAGPHEVALFNAQHHKDH